MPSWPIRVWTPSTAVPSSVWRVVFVWVVKFV
jgi:hypothetical protein